MKKAFKDAESAKAAADKEHEMNNGFTKLAQEMLEAKAKVESLHDYFGRGQRENTKEQRESSPSISPSASI